MTTNTIIKNRATASAVNAILYNLGDEHIILNGDRYTEGFFTDCSRSMVRVQAVYDDALDIRLALKRWGRALRDAGFTTMVADCNEALYAWERKDG